jgi:hypothetical protein
MSTAFRDSEEKISELQLIDTSYPQSLKDLVKAKLERFLVVVGFS